MQENLGNRSSTYNWAFSFDDIVADVDGYLIGARLSEDEDRPIDDVVREVHAMAKGSNTWRFSRFLIERFDGSKEVARAAALDVLDPSHFLVDAALNFTVGGASFVLNDIVGDTPITPQGDEAQAVADAWANLFYALAFEGPSAAPGTP